MAGWLHGVFVGDWLFVFPLCGFSLSLFCNYSLRHSVSCRLLPRRGTLASSIRWIHYVGTASNIVWFVRVGHPATQAIAVQDCRIHMEPLMQPYASVSNEVHNFEFRWFMDRLAVPCTCCGVNAASWRADTTGKLSWTLLTC